MQINTKAQAQWNEYKDHPDSFKLRYPVRVCPVCGRPPVFFKVAGKRHMEWQAFDYCGSTYADRHQNISDAIILWTEAARWIANDFEKSNVQGYWKVANAQRKIDKWESTYGKLSFWKRGWLALTGNLPPKPELPVNSPHVPMFLEERQHYISNDPA